MSAVSPKPSSDAGGPVRLTRDAAEALRVAAAAGLRSGPGGQFEVGGLLTTTIEDGGVLVIDGLEPVFCEHHYGPSYRLSPEDVVRLNQKVDQIATSAVRKLAGFFRTSTGEIFDYSPDDITLVRDHLPGCSLLMLVKPFQDGHIDMRAMRLSKDGVWTPVTGFELSRPAGLPAVSDHPKKFAPFPVPAPLEFPPDAPPRKFSLRVPSSWVAPAIIGVLLLVIVVIGFLRRPVPPSAASKADALGLHVEIQGNSLHLVWNHSVPGATEGVLRIDDGSLHRELVLDATQLDTGSILYRPSSDDVILRLEVRRESAAPLSESLRVLSGIGSGAPPELAVRSPVVRTSEPIAGLSPSYRKVVPLTSTVPEDSTQVNGGIIPATQPDTISDAKGARNGTVREFVPPPVRTESPSATDTASAMPLSIPVIDLRQAPQNPLGAVGRLVQPAAVRPPPPSARTETPVANRVPTPIVIPPRPLKQVTPNAKQIGSMMVYQPRDVEVQVRIDRSGRVLQVTLAKSATPVNQFLTSQALAAAKQWVFQPATVDGRPVPSTTTIVFSFRPPGQ
jgi:TonB family protein